jgi:hypothetical protein
MTATVRIYSHASLITAPLSSAGGRFTTDAVMQLKQRYLAREKLSPDTSTAATSSADTAPNKTSLLLIQIQPGKTVHYEVIPSGFEAVVADTSSPTISGETVIEFGPGWTISVLESTE